MIAALRRLPEPSVSRPVGPTSPTGDADQQSPTPGRPRLTETLAHSRLPGLDGLRAIGVLSVLASHAAYTGGLPGDFGPTAFFVLSGFLITRILMRERQKTGANSIRRFYFARTLRIFPAYYAFLLVSYLLDVRAGQRWSPDLLVHAVTYTINYFNATNHHPTTSLAHAWSLGVEEQFYILWPLAFVILAARGRRAIIVGVSVAASAGIAWRSWLILGAHADPAYVYNAFETRYDNLAIGCLLALTLDYSRVLAIAEWCGKRVLFSVVTLALLLASRIVLPSAYHYSLGFTIDALLVAVLIVQVLQLYQARVWSWLEWRAVRYLGAISYPMYLYHAWGGSIARRVPGNIHVKFAAGVLATIVLASGSYYFIERPVLRLRPRRARETGITMSPVIQTQPAVVFLSSASPGI